MKTHYKFFIVTILFYNLPNAYSQCTPRPLPYAEYFYGTAFDTCSINSGGWTYIYNGPCSAGWYLSATQEAGGNFPEAKVCCGMIDGCPGHAVLNSPPFNTSSISEIAISFKHNLKLRDSTFDFNNTMIISVETSPDTITWTTAYTANYQVPGIEQSFVNETRVIQVSNISSPLLYIRFYVSGELFKLAGWFIDNVNLSIVSDVNEIVEEAIRVYPNPASSFIEISSQGYEISGVDIYNSFGKELHSVQVRRNLSGTIRIASDELTAGIYFLRLQTQHGTVAKKIAVR